MKRIVFRADGGGERGFGHVVRCSRIAELLDEQNYKCMFVTLGDADAVKYLERSGFEVYCTNQENIENTILSLNTDMVVHDIRDTDAAYIRWLKTAGMVVVNFDDTGSGRSVADAVIDANIPAGKYLNEDNQCYFGADYIALDPQFGFFHKQQKEIVEHARKILVLMGGSDPCGLTGNIYDALKPISIRYDINIIVGPGNKDFFTRYDGYSSEGITVLQDVNCMPKLMAEADIGITSGGISMFEMAAVGTPNIVLCQAAHEIRNARQLEDQGIVLSLGMGNEVLDSQLRGIIETLSGDTARRRMMSQNAKAHVDASGMERIISIISGLLQERKCLTA